MTRGTTPTLTFELPFEADRLAKLNIAFSQDDAVVLEKGLADCTTSDVTVKVELSEADTLQLKQNGSNLYIQLRCKLTDGRCIASDIMTATVGRILKDGALA
ncbi:MAG: hypothetical protein Q3985_01170 [Eubacteriales bacterium]|nr:hypothetical protein [Eubacteriales bacterium]